MNKPCLKFANHIVYMEVDDFVRIFTEELGISNLRNIIEVFREAPHPEGIIVNGGNRISVRFFYPSLAFSKPIEKGENIWVSMGEHYPCYCLEKTEPWRNKQYFCFTHKDCEYYPCHVANDMEQFNCLFCFCPLYCLGKKCGGNYNYSGNIKDCSNCMTPHLPDSYGYIMNKFNDIIATLSRIEDEEPRRHNTNPDKRVI